MADTGVTSTRGIELQLSAVASQLHELTQAQTITGVELREFKERLLDSVETLEKKVHDLEKANANLNAQVSALQSRQTPLTAPAAWIAIIISGIVAAKSFFGG